MNRRDFLGSLLSASTAAALGTPLSRALAAPLLAQDDFFLLVLAQGAWDITLGLDPRNERRGLIEPGSTNTVDVAPIRKWTSLKTPLDGVNASSGYSFDMVRPPSGSLLFGPAIGELLRHHSRLTIVNGIAMNTVSHQDGTAYSTTGRHLSGNKTVAPSLDTMVADSLGAAQLFPAVSIGFPSSFVGQGIDRRATPLAISGIGTLAASLRRSTLYETADARDAVTTLLTEEARDLAHLSAKPDVLNGLSLQFESLRRINRENLLELFTDSYLRGKYPNFSYATMGASVNAAFAIDSFRRNVSRCVSFSYGSFDTHFSNYRQQALLQQNLFDLLATVLDYLDSIPHPTKAGSKLSDTTHILVVSDFCRTPMINPALGRDHYPNNSTLIVSPKFRGGMAFGKADDEQLLPQPTKRFSDGLRAITPADVLATFLTAMGTSPRKYMRDGEAIPEILQ